MKMTWSTPTRCATGWQQQDPQPTLLVMEHAGHFFHRRLMDLRGLLKNGVTGQLPPMSTEGA